MFVPPSSRSFVFIVVCVASRLTPSNPDEDWIPASAGMTGREVIVTLPSPVVASVVRAMSWPPSAY